MAVDIVATIVDKIHCRLWVPIGRQFGYLLHYRRNLVRFREELAKLEDKLSSLQDDIDSATRNGELIRPEVTNWRTKACGFKEEATYFLEDSLSLQDKRCFNGWFPNLGTRYYIGKAAKKKILATRKLKKDGKFDSISTLLPPLGIYSMSSANVVAYGTTKVAISKVMQALGNENINFVGIHGMGGVGKTTLVKEVGKQAKETKLFDEVVMAVVSQNTDVRKIQGQLADMLGLHLGEESEIGRAGRLLARIKGVGKILVILDDVWAKFDVGAVGIPFCADHKGCKIIVTTRRLEVCITMCGIGQSQEIVPLDVLTETESWDLFCKNSGEVANPIFYDVARDIAKECGGLPVALVTVGSGMKGIEDPENWKEALLELRRSVPRNIEGVEENVFKCIKFSYDYLKNKEAKQCFLLCSLFPEDYDVEIELLARYAVGLEVIEDVDTVEDVRRRVKLLIKKLKDSFLLIPGKDEHFIKMHDVVRDVALSIGSEEYFVRAGVGLKEWPKKGILDHYTGVSLMENKITELPCNFSGKTNLKILLLLQENRGVLWKDSFFEEMNALRVLDLRNEEISPTLGWGKLTCLQTLVLDGTEFESSTNAIGEIETLVVLSLRFCRFKESPNFIRNLTNLKLLDMSLCKGNIVFQPNSIARLTHLEELNLECSITRWESGKELNSLCHLKVLKFYVDKSTYLPEDFEFPDNLESFFIGNGWITEYKNYRNTLHLSDTRRGTIWWLNCVKSLLKITDLLYVIGFSGEKNIIPNLLTSNDQSDLDVVKSLDVRYCNESEWIIDYSHPHSQSKALSNLESLSLFNLDCLRGLCNGTLPSSVMSLSKLRDLYIYYCDNLLVAISPYSLLLRLKELELLYVESCCALERLFDFTDQLGYKISHDVELNLLLPNLKTVTVSECSRLKELFHPCMAQSLQKLEVLELYDSDEIKEIVTNENGHTLLDHGLVFKSLKEINLIRLPSLNGFCMGSFSIKFPSLQQVEIYDCPKMKTFTAAVDIDNCPKLKEIKVDGVKIRLQGVDLNTVLRNHFKAKETENDSQVSN